MRRLLHKGPSSISMQGFNGYISLSYYPQRHGFYKTMLRGFRDLEEQRTVYI